MPSIQPPMSAASRFTKPNGATELVWHGCRLRNVAGQRSRFGPPRIALEYSVLHDQGSFFPTPNRWMRLAEKSGSGFSVSPGEGACLDEMPEIPHVGWYGCTPADPRFVPLQHNNLLIRDARSSQKATPEASGTADFGPGSRFSCSMTPCDSTFATSHRRDSVNLLESDLLLEQSEHDGTVTWQSSVSGLSRSRSHGQASDRPASLGGSLRVDRLRLINSGRRRTCISIRRTE